MDRPLLLPLAACTQPSLVGGKAAGLARLLAGGFPVPSGFCVTTEAYDHALRA
ncbi:MAG: pyruvate, water dikinase, partial [Planctomycetaceae bacterium]